MLKVYARLILLHILPDFNDLVIIKLQATILNSSSNYLLSICIVRFLHWSNDIHVSGFFLQYFFLSSFAFMCSMAMFTWCKIRWVILSSNFKFRYGFEYKYIEYIVQLLSFINYSNIRQWPNSDLVYPHLNQKGTTVSFGFVLTPFHLSYQL